MGGGGVEYERGVSIRQGCSKNTWLEEMDGWEQGRGVHRTMARRGERIEDKAFVRKCGRSTFHFQTIPRMNYEIYSTRE